MQESGVHPIAVVPFKISKDEAVTIFDKWIKSRKFAPNDLKKLAKLKKLSGLYAPIFLFNFTATTEYSASCSNDYEDRKGNKRRGPTRYINDIETKEFYNYIYTANKGLSSKIFRKLDCCIFSNVKSYQSEYMLGFTGVSSDYSVHDAYNGTKDEVSSSEASRLKSRLNSRYDNVSFFKSTTILSDVTNSYVYFPIWANHYHYKKKDFHCYINGDNGKVYGKSPKSLWKLLGFVSAIVGVGLLLFLLLKH